MLHQPKFGLVEKPNSACFRLNHYQFGFIFVLSLLVIPKKFKEKKEMYGRDPRKLFETYQEEWDRLERLSDKSLFFFKCFFFRHGPRRKSILNLSNCDVENSRSPSVTPSLDNL
uniref:Uncharacterized protein n=1 Tax=Heterorhabditis bacteriophora TaxID=37862 RepID=A0A1I7WAU2_HETBA